MEHVGLTACGAPDADVMADAAPARGGHHEHAIALARHIRRPGEGAAMGADARVPFPDSSPVRRQRDLAAEALAEHGDHEIRAIVPPLDVGPPHVGLGPMRHQNSPGEVCGSWRRRTAAAPSSGSKPSRAVTRS